MSENLLASISSTAELVNKYIHDMFSCKQSDELYRASYHLLKAGGKRLRPFLVIKCCEAVGGAAESALPAAVAVELLHNFTLIHDDVMDQDELRRGVPTVHMIWGMPMAILAGDLLFAKAFEVTTNLCYKDLPTDLVAKVVGRLAKVTITISEGQSLDMLFSAGKQIISEDDYLTMISKKTAALFEVSAALGGLIGGANAEVIDALEKYGFSIGMAFQIKDDVLGVTSTSEVLGKPVGSDIRGGKKTLVILHALANSNESQRNLILSTLGNQGANKQEVKRVLNLLTELGSVEYAERKAREYVYKAKQALGKLPESNSKNLLKELANFIVERRL